MKRCSAILAPLPACVRTARRALFAVALASAFAAAPVGSAVAQAAAGPQRLSHGLFEDLQIYAPAGEVKQFVLQLSGSNGFDAGDRQRALAMSAAGAMVAGIAIEPFYRRLETEGGECSFANGAFENLAHHLQAYYKLPTYLTPMLVGRDRGAALAYAMLAQAQPGTFSAALTLGFCPRLTGKIPLCKAYALDLRPLDSARGSEFVPKPPLPSPWVSIERDTNAACSEGATQNFIDRLPQARRVELPRSASTAGVPPGDADALPAFRAAFTKLAEGRNALGPPPASLSDLPIVELPASGFGAAASRKQFAVLLSGDGGWAGLAQGVAASLAASGIPVAGFDSLRYFWTPRTPERVAADMDRLIRYYAAHWKSDGVLLIGYSQGADVLPFVLNRLPAATRAMVRQSTLIALGQKASFEFHVANWIGRSGDYPIAPEAMKLDAAATLCIYGTDERESGCPALAPKHVRALGLPGGHHFGGDYGRLADSIIRQ